MKYQYGILLTDVSPEAEQHNNALLGKLTLGIEVTLPALACRCGLGNIDPQHNGGSSSSAIEQSLVFSLPPDGAHLVTIRPDMDSFGAMAVLTLRAQGKETKIDKRLVAWIGAMDRMGYQNASANYPELAGNRELTDAIQAIIYNLNQHYPTMEAKITEIGRILIHEMSQHKIGAIASQKRRNREDFSVEIHGAIVFIEAPGKYGDARDWGNRRYPTVVVCDPAYALAYGSTQTRWSLVRQLNTFDRRGFEEKINIAEAQARGISLTELKNSGYAWGGPCNIVSSPMGKGRKSILTKELIIRIAQECAESGHVS